jgi:exodeoxyribonuclease V alpha subunit
MMLKSLLECQVIAPIDTFLAERLLAHCSSRSEESLLFLCLMTALMRQGHIAICLDKDKLAEQVSPLCQHAPDLIPTLCGMLEEGALRLPSEIIADVNDPLDFPTKPLCRFGNQIYFQKNWVNESTLLRNLQRLNQPPDATSAFLQTISGSLNAEQQEAVKKGILYPLSLITGGPGTGKTYTAAYLVLNYLKTLREEQREKFRLILTAPTGKAVAQLEKNISKHLPKTPSIISGTLHSLLNLKEEKPSPLLADLILVDECSMIDSSLFARLVESILDKTHLVLIGDPNQLPPVEAGSFFADLIDSAVFPVTQLKQSLRMEREQIFQLASDIQKGNAQSVLEQLKSASPSVHYINLIGSKTQVNLWAQVKDNFPQPTLDEPDWETLVVQNEQFRILSCMRQGPFGVDAINQILFKQYLQAAPQEGWLSIPILITRNDYQMDLYNGDTGFLIKRISPDLKYREDYALFPDKRRFSFYALPPFEYAYCLSVHKSQGSEYNEILLLIPEGSEVFGREVLYTAVTRARHTLTCAGELHVIEKAIQRSSRKISGLPIRLKSLQLHLADQRQDVL